MQGNAAQLNVSCIYAVGGSNLLSGLVGGFIVAGGASQSAASDKAGARSQVMGLVVAGLAGGAAAVRVPPFPVTDIRSTTVNTARNANRTSAARAVGPGFTGTS